MLRLTTYEVVNLFTMELYHVLNRGVEKRDIFMEDGDRLRFVHNLYEFNTDRAANNTSWNIASHGPINDLRGRYSRRGRGQLVDIHGWCLMRNHYHLLVSERVEKGLSKFLMKLNVGYAKYFNEKYHRSGTLFQGRTKKVHVMTDPHFLYILHYIHLNPLDFLRSSKHWREQEIGGVRQALAHLDAYRWSSFRDYCGKKNFPSIITRELFKDVFRDYRKVVGTFLKTMDNSPLQNLDLE